MQTESAQQLALDRICEMISQRSESYETGVQTTVYWKSTSGWLNLLTKINFLRKREDASTEFAHEYPEIVMVRRLLSDAATTNLLKRLITENVLETGHSSGSIPFHGRFSLGGKTRWPHGEWSSWPADVFVVEPPSGQPWAPDGSLKAADAPYYPSFEQVLSDLFGIRTQGWHNYFRGQVVIVLPDFRARISKLILGLGYLLADLECLFLQPRDLLVKIYAETPTRCLFQETVHPERTFVQIELADKPSLACAALLCGATGETLDENIFREGVSWREPGVVVETIQPEIEQMLLTGESETVEFRERLDPTRPTRLAKTAAAFANTKGGMIVFGVDDDHRVVGCDAQQMADTVTNIIRGHCDPPPMFRNRIVRHDDKELLLIEVTESVEALHLVKELGLFVRANATNRIPTSHELELLIQRRRGSASGIPGILGR